MLRFQLKLLGICSHHVPTTPPHHHHTQSQHDALSPALTNLIPFPYWLPFLLSHPIFSPFFTTPPPFLPSSSLPLFSYLSPIIHLIPSLPRCVNLEKIEATNNVIQSLPHELGRLLKLKSFDLTTNKLNVVPPGIFFSAFFFSPSLLHFFSFFLLLLVFFRFDNA